VKRILFITSQYRTGERIYPILPHLCKEYSVDLLKVYQMTKKYKWVGDIDMRKEFDKNYLDLFDRVYENKCNVTEYDLIISDDNRDTPKTNLRRFYKEKSCPLVSFEHGNTDKPYFLRGHKVVFDKCFVFGKKNIIYSDCIASGIPSNDELISCKNVNKKHILVIVNFLGNRNSPFKVNFTEETFRKLQLLDLQQQTNLPVLIKLKSRADERGYISNLEYLKKILPGELDYKIVIDVQDDNKLVAESKYVITAPSTLAFKPIQLGIPTIIIRDSGQAGSFSDYEGMFDIDEIDLNYFLQKPDNTEWILNTIEGGLDFTSTIITVDNLKKLL
jgi:hypothetical protein